MSSEDEDYDVIVIGAGPAGYVAAIRAAQLGFKVACVDKSSNSNRAASLGGTYINAGCIATMSLLESAKIYHLLHQDLSKHGIQADNIRIDIAQMQSRKAEIICQLSEQIKQCFDYYGITGFHAQGQLLADKRVKLNIVGQDQPGILQAEHIILATGSLPARLNCAPLDNQLVIDSTAALNMTQLPKKLGIIGAGIIGLELGGIWHRLGAEVILLDAQEQFLPLTDAEIAQEAFKIYTAQGLDLRLGARVISAQKQQNSVVVEFQQNGKIQRITKSIN
jgi:dihydrolipoamide dehydrogenase